MFTSMKNRSVVVTGASKGIGKGIAKVFSAAGCKVLVVARSISRINTLFPEIKKY
ncbi:MAG: SDR family NAD(P)-dependent oxidoreductase [Gammaproteobacteria bacterium]|nr:SDR family NAD(P)-dependent oxidoreductase [Gammaproteobacteria bacterium]